MLLLPPLPTVLTKFSFHLSRIVLLWFCVIVMLRFLSRTPVFLAFPPPPPLLLFALNVPCRLAAVADALSGMVNSDLLLRLLLLLLTRLCQPLPCAKYSPHGTPKLLRPFALCCQTRSNYYFQLSTNTIESKCPSSCCDSNSNNAYWFRARRLLRNGSDLVGLLFAMKTLRTILPFCLQRCRCGFVSWT
jgi:hypothetical protein